MKTFTEIKFSKCMQRETYKSYLAEKGTYKMFAHLFFKKTRRSGILRLDHRVLYT